MFPVNYQPYQPPETASTSHSSPDSKLRTSRFLWLVAYLYPPALIGSLYGTWLIAWYELGHMPQPNVDDPKSIGGIFGFCTYLPLLLFMLFPIVLPLGLVALLYGRSSCGQQSKARLWLMAAIYVLLWLLTLWTIRWDPLRVAEWYGD